MNLLSHVFAAGIWPALPLTGYYILKKWSGTSGAVMPGITCFSLVSVLGVVVWSAPMLLAALLGLYRGEFFGAAGWVIVLFSLARLLKNKGAVQVRFRMSLWKWGLVAGLTTAGLLYIGFPSESISIERDEGLYSNHAVFISHHGRLDVPYPWTEEDDALLSRTLHDNYPGLYHTRPAMTMQFPHLFAVWLAQAFSSFGEHGLFRLNAVFSLMALFLFYGFSRAFMSSSWAVGATLFLAFNPAQLWTSRVALTEILSQLCMWSGLFLMFMSIRDNDKESARLAGIFLGFVAFVRIDTFFLALLMLGANLVIRIVSRPEEDSGPVWSSFYRAYVPLCVLALLYYAVDARIYFLGSSDRMIKLGLGICLAVPALVLMRGRILEAARTASFNRMFLVAVGVFLGIALVYLYYLRPVYAMINGFRDTIYSEFSLINLSQYITIFVIVAGSAGWFFCLRSILARRKDLSLLPLMVSFAGFAALYLWKPSINPEHFWAVRRFVPIIIPGFIFFGFLGMNRFSSLFPEKWAGVLTAFVLVSLGVFTIRADRPILFSADYEGSFKQLGSMAAHLPADASVIADGSYSWVMPLYLAFDRSVVYADADGRDKGPFRRWISDQTAKNRPVYLLCEGEFNRAGLDSEEVFSTVLSRSFIENTYFPLPRKFVQDEKEIRLYKIKGMR